MAEYDCSTDTGARDRPDRPMQHIKDVSALVYPTNHPVMACVHQDANERVSKGQKVRANNANNARFRAPNVQKIR